MTTLTELIKEVRDFISYFKTTPDAIRVNADAAMSKLTRQYPIMRMTPGQSLLPNAEKTIPLGFNSVYCTWQLVESVFSGNKPTERSAIAKEFLQCLFGGQPQHFWGNFNIWSIKYTNVNGRTFYAGHFPIGQAYTVRCVAKHISGDVLNDNILNGLVAGEDAKIVGYTSNGGGNPFGYTAFHPVSSGVPMTGEIYIALPAAVCGRVEEGVWGIYPYQNHDKGVAGFGIWE